MLGFGALGEFAVADFGTPPPPVGVVLPAVSIAFTVRTPFQAAGKSFSAPIEHIALAALAGATITGRLIGLPASPLTAMLPLPKSLPGKLIGLPTSAVGFTGLLPNLQTGRIISLADTVTLFADVGALAGGALGEFALGDGESIGATFEIPVRLKFVAQSVAAQSGKNFAVPLIPIAIQAPLPEPDARSRAIRINVIAS